MTPISAVHAAHADLPAGEETEARYRVAGRLHARRGQGKMAFLDLDDRSGRIQLQARVDVLGEEAMARLLDLDLGDIVGVDGVAFRSRRGELSLRVEGFELLAKSLRPPPDKFHGLQDVETRFRHRELDLIANEESRAVFIARARVVSAIRAYLDDAGLHRGRDADPAAALRRGDGAPVHHPPQRAGPRRSTCASPTELYLKRLIVGGLERVYELAKDFRNEGISYKHNPEFTMLEWYEAYADYEDVMRRVEELLPRVAQAAGYAGEVDFTPPYRRVTLRDAIHEATGIDVLEVRDRDALAAAIAASDVDIPTDGLTWPELVDDLFSKVVEPTLVQPTFVIDFPKEISPLAKDHRSEPGLVERFEAFAGGMELANAFSELNDPDEQRARFEAQRRFADEGHEEAMPFDEAYLQALEQGLPPTGGIGIGIDRLVMLLTGKRTIREVVLFPAMRD